VAREESIVATCSTRLTPSLTVFLRLPMPDATTARRAVLLVKPGIDPANADAALAARDSGGACRRDAGRGPRHHPVDRGPEA